MEHASLDDLTSRVHNLLGLLYLSQSRHEESLEAFHASLSALEGAPDDDGTRIARAVIHNNIGLIYREQNFHERALEHYLNTVIANRIQHYLQSANPVIDGIEGFLCSAVSANLENFPFQSCMLVNTAAELGQQKPGIGAVIRSGFKRIDIALRDAVERAQRAREIAPQFEASLLAGQLALMLPGLILAKRNGAHTDQLLATIRAMIRSWRIPEVPNNNQESDHD